MDQARVPALLYLGPFATMADRFAVAPLLIPIAANSSLFKIGALITVPVLVFGTIATVALSRLGGAPERQPAGELG